MEPATQQEIDSRVLEKTGTIVPVGGRVCWLLFFQVDLQKLYEVLFAHVYP